MLCFANVLIPCRPLWFSVIPLYNARSHKEERIGFTPYFRAILGAVADFLVVRGGGVIRHWDGSLDAASTVGLVLLKMRILCMNMKVCRFIRTKFTLTCTIAVLCMQLGYTQNVATLFFPLKVMKGGKYGLVDSLNNLIVPCDYDISNSLHDRHTPVILTKNRDRRAWESTAFDAGGNIMMTAPKGWKLSRGSGVFYTEKYKTRKVYTLDGELIDTCYECRYQQLQGIPYLFKLRDGQSRNVHDTIIDVLNLKGEKIHEIMGRTLERGEKKITTGLDPSKAIRKYMPLDYIVTGYQAPNNDPKSKRKWMSFKRMYDLEYNLLYDSVVGFLGQNAHEYIAINSSKGPVLVDLNLNVVLPNSLGYKYIGCLTPMANYFSVFKNGLRGVIDEKGKEIIPCQYNGQFSYNAGYFECYLYDGPKWIYFDKNANRIFHDNFHFESRPMNEIRRNGENTDYLVVWADGDSQKKYGVFSLKKSKLVVDTIYQKLGRPKDGKVIFMADSLVGQIDIETGKIDLQMEVEGLSNEMNGVFLIRKEEPSSRDLNPCPTSGYHVKDYYFVDKSGEILAGPYDWVYDYSDVGFTVSKDCEISLLPSEELNIRVNVAVKLPKGCTLSSHFRKGYALIRKGNKLGIIDSTSRVILPAKYDHIELEQVWASRPYIYSLQGSGLTGSQRGKVPKIIDGKFVVRQGDEYILFDRKGKKVKFDKNIKLMSFFLIDKHDNYFRAEYMKDGIKLRGVFTTNGTTIIEDSKDLNLYYYYGYLRVKTSGTMYYLNRDGVKQYYAN